ncbi:hypothetical protein ACFE04_022296 [Oxalis oulophora]
MSSTAPLAKLELRPLGNTGLMVSSVGFGASPLGKVFGPVSDDEAIASVRRAFDLGINFFDTSPFYGGTLSEKVLGKALKALGAPRNEIIVATKCGRYKEGFDFSAERVTKSIDESLERLQLDYVDILHCHDIEFGSLDQIVNETIPALLKLKEAGKTRFIGITGLPLEIYTYVLDRVPPGSVDVILSYCHYSINDSTLEDLLPYLKSKNVGVISASPLAMGLLTENGPPEWHPASPELKSACKAAAAYCKDKGKKITKLAMQYSLSNKDISSVLVGMNAVEQVEENVAAAIEVQLFGQEQQTLAEIQEVLKPVIGSLQEAVGTAAASCLRIDQVAREPVMTRAMLNNCGSLIDSGELGQITTSLTRNVIRTVYGLEILEIELIELIELFASLTER